LLIISFKHQRCLTEGEEASKQRLLYACLLSTKGAYYGANKQASISCIARDRRQDKRKQGKQAKALEASFYLCAVACFLCAANLLSGRSWLLIYACLFMSPFLSHLA
jgi:hypothetical protein